MGKWQGTVVQGRGFREYPGKRRVNFDHKAGSLGGGGTQQGLSANNVLGTWLRSVGLLIKS